MTPLKYARRERAPILGCVAKAEQWQRSAAAPWLWLLCALSVLCSGRARADEHHCLWSVKGAHNTVYLLGSVHALKPADAELPAVARDAYAHAHTLVMELDVNSAMDSLALDPQTLQSAMAEQPLESALGAALYQQVKTHAEALGLTMQLLDSLQPWFVAMVLEQTQLAHQGFDPNSGIDMQLAQRASSDHKAIVPLETVAEQLGFFAHLSLAEQRNYLRQTLDDLDHGQPEIDSTVQAWKQGDMAELGRVLRTAQAQDPALFRILTVERNHRWLPQLVGLLRQDQDVLVVVGTLHLVGPDGLLALLQNAGYAPAQL